MRLRNLAIAALTLSCAAKAESEAVSREPIEASPRFALWAAPVLTAATAVVFDTPLLRHSRLVVVPLGMSISVKSGLNLVAEASVLSGWDWEGYESTTSFTQVAVAVGPEFGFGDGSKRFTGFFILPKLICSFWWAREDFGWGGPLASSSRVHLSSSPEIQLGVDAGYQHTWGSFYVAPLVGFSAGVGWRDSWGAVELAGPIGGPSQRQPEPQLVVAINVNLVRIGATF